MGLLFSPSGLKNAQQRPVVPFTPQAVAFAAVRHSKDLRDFFTATDNGAQAGVDEVVGRAFEFDAARVSAHPTAEADGGDVNWTVNGCCFHIRYSLSLKIDLLVFGK